MNKLRSYIIESFQDIRFDGPAICHDKSVTISYSPDFRIPRIRYRGMEQSQPIEIFPISAMGVVYIGGMHPGEFSFDIAIPKQKLVTILRVIGATDYARVVEMI